MSIRTPLWGPWIVVLTPYIVTFIMFSQIYHRDRKKLFRIENYLIFALSVMGIVEYSYFIGRSAILYLTVVSVPSIIVAFYWYASAANAWHRNVRYIAWIFCFWFCIGLITMQYAPFFSKKFPDTGYYFALKNTAKLVLQKPLEMPGLTNTIKAQPAASPQVTEAISAINRYARDQKTIPLLIDPEYTTQALVFLRKSNLFPMSNPDQDNILVSNLLAADAYIPPLSAGDIIFIAADEKPMLPLQLKFMAGLRKLYQFETLETSANGIQVIRLKSK
jgi:hypothetical protein